MAKTLGVPTENTGEKDQDFESEFYMTPINKKRSPRRYDRLGIETSDRRNDTQSLIEHLMSHQND